MINYNDLTYPQKTWLTQRGGRTVDDVLVDNDRRLYVLMFAPEGDQKVYLPQKNVVEPKMAHHNDLRHE